MTKFGTPIGAGPTSAIVVVGLVRAGWPSGWTVVLPRPSVVLAGAEVLPGVESESLLEPSFLGVLLLPFVFPLPFFPPPAGSSSGVSSGVVAVVVPVVPVCVVPVEVWVEAAVEGWISVVAAEVPAAAVEEPVAGEAVVVVAEGITTQATPATGCGTGVAIPAHLYSSAEAGTAEAPRPTHSTPATTNAMSSFPRFTSTAVLLPRASSLAPDAAWTVPGRRATWAGTLLSAIGQCNDGTGPGGRACG